MLVRLPPESPGWHGPIHGTYSDSQCPNIGCHSWKGINQSDVATQLKAVCDGTKGCTAFNVGGGGGCLRACLSDRLIRYNISGGGCCSYFRIGPPSWQGSDTTRVPRDTNSTLALDHRYQRRVKNDDEGKFVPFGDFGVPSEGAYGLAAFHLAGIERNFLAVSDFFGRSTILRTCSWALLQCGII